MGFEPPTDADDDLNAFDQGLGAISSLYSGAITPSHLSDVDRLVAMLPDDAFAPAEIEAIGDFVASGGTCSSWETRRAFPPSRTDS